MILILEITFFLNYLQKCQKKNEKKISNKMVILVTGNNILTVIFQYDYITAKFTLTFIRSIAAAGVQQASRYTLYGPQQLLGVQQASRYTLYGPQQLMGQNKLPGILYMVHSSCWGTTSFKVYFIQSIAVAGVQQASRYVFSSSK